MESPSSTNEQTEAETTRRIVKFESKSAQLSPASPFALPFLRPLMVNVPRAVEVMQKSVSSTAERCAEMAQSLFDANPLLRKFASLSSELRQIQIRNRQSQYVSFHPNGNFAAILPGDSVAGMVVTNGVLNFLNIYNTILVVRLVLTWFPNAPPAIVSPLSTLCDPYLNIFRGLIPPLGGTLDLSPILAFLVLNAFTSTASALPAELPPSMRSQEGHVLHENQSNFKTSQEKWARRFSGDKSRNCKRIDK